ncbi:hypothetical protein U1Q18_039696, partial [Sarracenia purpurea var. burkii]
NGNAKKLNGVGHLMEESVWQQADLENEELLEEGDQYQAQKDCSKKNHSLSEEEEGYHTQSPYPQLPSQNLELNWWPSFAAWVEDGVLCARALADVIATLSVATVAIGFLLSICLQPS